MCIVYTVSCIYCVLGAQLKNSLPWLMLFSLTKYLGGGGIKEKLRIRLQGPIFLLSSPTISSKFSIFQNKMQSFEVCTVHNFCGLTQDFCSKITRFHSIEPRQ